MSLRHAPLPLYLEICIVAHGPTVLRDMVEKVGGPGPAALLCSKLPTTISAWMHPAEEGLFGQRRRQMRSYQSLSLTYPAPFPLLDRICEVKYGEGESFLRVLSQRSSLGLVLEQLRSKSGFGLELLREDWGEIFKIGTALGAPRTSMQRWRATAPYPQSWTGLDRLAREVGSSSWIEAVLASEPRQARAVPDREGVQALAREAIARRIPLAP